MEDNKTLILKEFEKHKGEFVIADDWKVKRLIAIGRDDRDYYYVLYDGRSVVWHSCVGAFIPLKGKIEDDEYKNFQFIARLNSFDQVRPCDDPEDYNARVIACNKHKAEIENLSEGHEYLTPVCWEIN